MMLLARWRIIVVVYFPWILGAHRQDFDDAIELHVESATWAHRQNFDDAIELHVESDISDEQDATDVKCCFCGVSGSTQVGSDCQTQVNRRGLLSKQGAKCTETCATFGRSKNRKVKGTCRDAGENMTDCQDAPMLKGTMICCLCADPASKVPACLIEKIRDFSANQCHTTCNGFGRLFSQLETCVPSAEAPLCLAAAPLAGDVIPWTNSRWVRDKFNVMEWFESHEGMASMDPAVVNVILAMQKTWHASRGTAIAHDTEGATDLIAFRDGQMKTRLAVQIIDEVQKWVRRVVSNTMRVLTLAGQSQAVSVLASITSGALAFMSAWLLPVAIPFKIFYATTLTWVASMHFTLQALALQASLNFRMTCLDYKLKPLEKLNNYNSIELQAPVKKVCPAETHDDLKVLLKDSGLALLEVVRDIRTLGRCLGVADRRKDFSKRIMFAKTECSRLAPRSLFDPEHGLLAQFAFQAQVWHSVQSKIIDKKSPFRGKFAWVPIMLGGPYYTAGVSRLMDSQAASFENCNGTKLANCQASCVSVALVLSQQKQVFKAFARTLRLWSKTRLRNNRWRAPGIDLFGMKGRKNALTVIHPCKLILNEAGNESGYCDWSLMVSTPGFDEDTTCSKAQRMGELWSGR